MDVSKFDLFGEEVHIKDATAREEIATLNTKIDNKKTEYINNVPYPYHNVYLDGTNGNDDNNGLTRQTAFRTYDRAMEEAKQWGDFRIWILTSGEYTWSNPTANGITLHVIPLTTGITLKWGFKNPKVSVSIYNSHFNIGSDDYRMTITLPRESAENGETLYFENCATLFTNIDLRVYSKLGFFGGNFNIFKTNLHGWLDAGMSNGYLSDMEITPTANNQPAVTVRESATLGILNTFTFHNSISSAVTSFEAFRLHGGTLMLLVTVKNDGSSKFYQGFQCSHSMIFTSQAHLKAVMNLGTADSDFGETLVSSYVQQNPIQ